MFSDFLQTYLSVISTKNTELIRAYSAELSDRVTKDEQFSVEFAKPESITQIHEALVSAGVSPKALMLKSRVSSTRQRAILMASAIKIASEKL